MLILSQHSPDWALSWKAPAECTQAPAVAASVEKRLGYPVFGEPARYRIEGQVSPLAAGYHAQLTLQDADGTVLGTREVSTSEGTCAALDARITLVLALMISPSGAAPAPITAPPAQAPPMLPAPAAPGPLLRDDATVHVHLQSDDPRAQLVRLVENRSANVSYVATTVLCAAPCDKPVKASARLFIAGEGLITSDEFSLRGLEAATLHVKTGSAPRRVGGVLAMSSGIPVLVGGLLLMLLGVSNPFGSSAQTPLTLIEASP